MARWSIYYVGIRSARHGFDGDSYNFLGRRKRYGSGEARCESVVDRYERVENYMFPIFSLLTVYQSHHDRSKSLLSEECSINDRHGKGQPRFSFLQKGLQGSMHVDQFDWLLTM